MNVVFLTAHDIWGSLNSFSPMQKIMTHLAEHGHQVVLLTHDKVGDPSTRRYGPPVSSWHPNIQIHRFPLPGDRRLLDRLMKVPGLRSLYMRLRYDWLLPRCLYREFFRQHLDQGVDLIYGYEIFGAPAAARVARRVQKPLVLRFQGTFLYQPLAEAQRSWVGKLKLLRWGMHLKALRLPADLKIMTNDGTRGDWVLNHVGNASPYVFWFNGTSFGLAQQLQAEGRAQIRRRLGIPQDQPVLFSVSRLEPWKRVDRVIASMPGVLARVPNAHYYLAGVGESEANLRAMAQRLGVTEHVTFLGALPHEQVFSYMKAADVFVSAYDVSNVGNPLIEAMISGAAIVTLDVGDTHRLIESGANGFLLTPDDTPTMAGRIAGLLADPALRDRLGQATETKARELFWTWEDRLGAEEQELLALTTQRT